jgi:hypothetical protein
MLEQGSANPAGDRLALLVRMPIGGQNSDPLRGDQVAERGHQWPPSPRDVGIEQHDVRPGRRSLARGGLTRRLSDDEAMAREVIAESLAGSAVLTDDEQSAHG